MPRSACLLSQSVPVLLPSESVFPPVWCIVALRGHRVDIHNVVQEGGMLATHRHEAILGGSRVERMLSNAAEQRAVLSEPELAQSTALRQPDARQSHRGRLARGDNVPRASTDVPSEIPSQEPSVLALLAAWQSIPETPACWLERKG